MVGVQLTVFLCTRILQWNVIKQWTSEICKQKNKLSGTVVQNLALLPLSKMVPLTETFLSGVSPVPTIAW